MRSRTELRARSFALWSSGCRRTSPMAMATSFISGSSIPSVGGGGRRTPDPPALPRREGTERFGVLGEGDPHLLAQALGVRPRQSDGLEVHKGQVRVGPTRHD